MDPDGGLSAGDGRQGSMKLALSADKRLRSSSIDMPDNLGGEPRSRVGMPRRDSAEAVDSL